MKTTDQNLQCPRCGASVNPDAARNPSATPPQPQKEEGREYDHRGVLMPRRTRIGGIIIPQ